MANKDLPDDESAWNTAYEKAKRFGSVPATFSVPIRTLIADSTRDVRLGDASRFLLKRLLKSPSLRAPYAGALKLNFPDMLQTTDGVPTRASMVDACEPFAHAVILAMIYAYRRVRSDSNEDDLRFIGPPLQESAQVGSYVGRALPTVGFGLGMLIGTYRYLGLAVLTHGQSKLFKEYRRYVKDQERSFDTDWELDMWGCSSAQVGALLLQLFGFGVETANAIILGAETTSALSLKDHPAALATHVANRWIESFKFTGEAPEIPISERAVLPIDLRPSHARIEQLTTRVHSIPELGETLRWLDLGKSEADAVFDPSSIPVVSEVVTDAEEEGNYVEIPVYEELSPEIQAQFTKEEFEDMAVTIAELLDESE